MDQKYQDAREEQWYEIVKVTREDAGRTLSYEVLSTDLAGPEPPYERARHAANECAQPYGREADRWVELWSLDPRTKNRLSQRYDSRFDRTLERGHSCGDEAAIEGLDD